MTTARSRRQGLSALPPLPRAFHLRLRGSAVGRRGPGVAGQGEPAGGTAAPRRRRAGHPGPAVLPGGRTRHRRMAGLRRVPRTAAAGPLRSAARPDPVLTTTLVAPGTPPKGPAAGPPSAPAAPAPDRGRPRRRTGRPRCRRPGRLPGRRGGPQRVAGAPPPRRRDENGEADGGHYHQHDDRARAPSCTGASLAARQPHWQVTGGTLYEIVVLDDTSAAPCTLSGYANLRSRIWTERSSPRRCTTTPASAHGSASPPPRW